jgi:osmotically-inducible protein OsmY
MVATRTDAALRRQIEQVLRDDLRLDVRAMEVDVARGAIRLVGSVPNEFQKREALADARSVAGQASVADDLKVEPSELVPDHQVKYEAEAALVRDKRLCDTHVGTRKHVGKEVSVEVQGGVIILTGLVDTPAERHIVEEDVWGLPGVVGIDDRIAVAPAPTRPDHEIADDVRQTLKANPWIDSSDIRVAVHEQMADLTGHVPTREQKRLAGDGAWWVPGVKETRNDLRVRG